jgi:hypothetical protein
MSDSPFAFALVEPQFDGLYSPCISADSWRDRSICVCTVCLMLALLFSSLLIVCNYYSFVVYCAVSSDMSSQPEIENSIMQCFSSSNEEVKAAASYALGKENDIFNM